MAPPSGESVTTLLILAMQALGESQEGVGRVLGVSRRTVSRWVGHGASLDGAQCATLARAVHPRDPALAARIVAARGATLEDAGIAPPPRPAPLPAVAPPPTPPAHLVEVVVCAAAEALDVSPRVVRPALLAALKSARAVGLDVEAMEKALTPQSAPAPGRANARTSKDKSR
jgi:hypothetical protein